MENIVKTREMTELEEQMLELAMAQNGRLDLDFSDDLHYNYFMEQWGGREHLNKLAPAFLGVVEKQRKKLKMMKMNGELASKKTEETENNWGNTDQLMIACPTMQHKLVNEIDVNIKENSENVHEYISISGEPTVSYADDRGSEVSIDYKIRDTYAKKFLVWNKEYPEKVDMVYKTKASVDIPIPERERRYQISADITRIFTIADTNELTVNSSLICTSLLTRSTIEDIKSITYIDPIRKPDVVRSQNQDYISIFYSIDRAEGPPDYRMSNYSSSRRYMPVYLPYEMIVALKEENGAYFRTNDKGSYLSENYEPNITLSQLKSATGEPVAGGEVYLLQNWTKFSEECITVEKTYNQRAVALRLKFPVDWETQIEFATASYNKLYAALYSHVRFNTVNKNSIGVERDEETSIFGYFLQKNAPPYNPTAPGENTIHIPKFYFCWNCLTDETKILTPGGLRQAKFILPGDEVTLMGGKTARVKDVVRGFINSTLKLTTKRGCAEMTGGHLVYTPSGYKAAFELMPDDEVFIYDSVSGGEVTEKIIEKEVNFTESSVCDFLFEEGSVFVAGGFLVCDAAMHESIQRAKLPKPRYSHSLNIVRAQIRAMSGSDAPPLFVKSNEPECMALHYFAVAALARYITKWSEETIQRIAEYCQFIADNATVGGLFVSEVPEEINQAGICTVREDGKIIVPIIPTAMEKWYDDAELKELKPWLLLPDVDVEDRKYNMIDDVLRPFHYPPSSSNNPQVKFNTTQLMERLSGLAAKVNKSVMDNQLEMEIALAIHLLTDSMLHERYTAERNWVNLGRTDVVLAQDGTNATSKYPPFIDYPYGMLDEYPAGLQQSGISAHRSFLRSDYTYPLNRDELELDEGGDPLYSGHRTPVNASRFTRACKAVWDFLHDCIGKKRDETTWKQIIESEIEKLFEVDTLDYDTLCSKWKNAFSQFNYKYEADEVYKRIITGDTTKERDTERYAEFFRYTLLMHGEKLNHSLKTDAYMAVSAKAGDAPVKADIFYKYDGTCLMAGAEFIPYDDDESEYTLDVEICNKAMPMQIIDSRRSTGSGHIKCELVGIDVSDVSNKAVNYRVKAVVEKVTGSIGADSSSTKTRIIVVKPIEELLSASLAFGLDVSELSATANNAYTVKLKEPSVTLKPVGDNTCVGGLFGQPVFKASFKEKIGLNSPFEKYENGVLQFSDSDLVSVQRIDMGVAAETYVDVSFYDEEQGVNHTRRVHVVLEKQ